MEPATDRVPITLYSLALSSITRHMIWNIIWRLVIKLKNLIGHMLSAVLGTDSVHSSALKQKEQKYD